MAYQPAAARDLTKILPHELTLNILSHLNPRTDLSAARLATRAFSVPGTSLLVTKLELAMRLDTFHRFNAILNDPVFSQQVTTLVLDASQYSRDLAMDDQLYAEFYLDADRYNLDPWKVAVQQDTADLAAFGYPATGVRDIEQQHIRADADRMVWLARQDTWTNDTYPKYLQRYRVEQILRTAKATLHLIIKAFRTCKMLKHVVLTDYRGLAFKGESYAEACLRMFGATLPPYRFACEMAIDPVLTVIDALAAVPSVNLQSFSIGPNPFASVKGIMSREYGHRLTTELQLHGTMAVHPNRPLNNVFLRPFGALRHLRLAYIDENGDSYKGQVPENIWFMLTAAQNSLRHLSITRAGLDRPIVTPDRSRYPTDSDLFTLKFPNLKSLELHHFRLPSDDDLQEFLKFHATILRTLRLVDCILEDGRVGVDRAISLAEWGRRNLELEGIESVHAADLNRLADVPIGEDDEDRWVNINYPSAETAIQHVERLEQCWIGGRRNTLKRTVDVADRAERAQYNVDWWLRPAKRDVIDG